MTVLEITDTGYRALVERAIGRELRHAETAIDVLKLNAALEQAKDELEQAIRAEMLEGARAWALGLPLRLFTTAKMIKPLRKLHELGRREARAELVRAGYQPGRQLERFRAPDPGEPGLDAAERTIRRGLPALIVRIEDGLVAADLSGLSAAMIAEALLAIPGARDIASRVVSTALYSGMGQTFEENAHLVDGWEYTAVMDSGTCDACAPLDGTAYPSWDAIQEVLPGGGPNPECFGGGRCRCRAVPAPA